MAALGFAFLLCMTMSTIGSELKPWSGRSIVDNITALNQKVLDMEYSIPRTIQAANEEMLLYILDKIANNSEVHETHLQALSSDHSLRVEGLEKRVAQCDDVMLLKQNLSDITLRMEKLSQQVEQNQRDQTLRLEKILQQLEQNLSDETLGTEKLRKQLEDVQNRPATSALSLRAHVEKLSFNANKISCGMDSGQHIRFSRVLDNGTGWDLPTDARTFTRDGLAVLDLSRVPRGDKRGLFQCGHANRTGATFMINEFGRFVRPKFTSVRNNVMFGSDYSDAPSLRWLHDGQPVPAWDGRAKVEFVGVGKEDAGVYELYREGDRRRTLWLNRLVVRGCPAGFFGQGCDQECQTCYNGGLCDEKLGTCVCAPGFKGRRCEAACGRDRIGPDCSEACDGGDCSYQLFCLEDPHGCSCAAGYWGYYCQITCDKGKFGADCKVTCHCRDGSCDPYTGACSGGCSEGWTGASCQIPVGN